jgi:ERCC4-type nuclease
VLDYVVERKKADDLLSSIFDGRYKEQKYRLRNSGFGNVYYLFEGHLTGANATSEREVSSALLKTRVKDGFKVVRVQSITESVKFLTFMTESITQQLSSCATVKTLGTMEEFAANNGKSCNLTVEQIFGLSLKTVPGVGKASVS